MAETKYPAHSPTIEKRFLTEKEGMTYTSLGRSSLRKLGAEIGAIKHFGRRVMYDRLIIDHHFDTQ